MCGILGSVNINDTASYLDEIKHRGPDGSGAASFLINENQIHLLHRRLSIIELGEAGLQPMFSSDNKACITFNGEIYNHLQLREKLQGVDFKGHSDTETIANYFCKFGIEKSLMELNGIFSFAFLDIEKKLLYLARDRFGVKPLYYWFQNNQLLFSSEIRPFRMRLHPKIDVAVLAHSLIMRYTPSPSTVYEGIYKVEPGQLLKFDLASGITLEKSYFVPITRSLGTKKGEFKKLVKEYGDLFEKAVERQLMSDVEVGILLSSGVDSALVAAIAKQKSKSALKTFTVGFEGVHHGIDEITLAKHTAHILGLENYSRKTDSSHLLSSIKEIVEIVEEPIGTTSILPMYYLSQLASSQVKVVLSGQGADEPLGGYHKYRSLPLLEYSRNFKSLMNFTKSAKYFYNKKENIRRLASAMQCSDDIDSLIELNAISGINEVANLMVPSMRKHYKEVLRAQQRFINETWKKRMPGKNTSIKNLFLYYDTRTSLADDLLMYTDKVTMHFGLECRVPILDNELIEFIESLKPQYKFNSREGKIIHKKFAKEYLPSSIIERKKLDFKSPTEAWFRSHYKQIMEIFSAFHSSYKHIDVDAVKGLLSRHYNGKNLEKHIFLLLSMHYLALENEPVKQLS